MSLILATQARCSLYYPFRSGEENHEYDKQIRENLDELSKSVRWRMCATKRQQDELASPSSVRDGAVTDEFGMPKDGSASAPKRHSIHRGPSLSQSGRYRRRGWRASANMSQVYGEEPTPTATATAASFIPMSMPMSVSGSGSGSRGPSRQNSDYGYPYTANGGYQEWHPTLAEEDDEDDNTTPGQSYAYTGPPSRDGYTTNPSVMSETPSTYTSTSASTLRGYEQGYGNGGGQVDWEASQMTTQVQTGNGPGGMFPRRRQTSGPGSRSSTPGPGAGPPDIRRRETGRI
jgi:hypothetical protein